jgi:hypothetical protein
VKRAQRESSKPSRAARTIDPKRLSGVRGGTDLGIAIDVPPPPSNVMQQQHNEALLRAGGSP